MTEVLEHEFFADKELRRIKYQRNFELKNSCQSTRNHHPNSEFSLSSLGMFSCRAGKENLNPDHIFVKKNKENNALDRRRTNTVHIGSQVALNNQNIAKKASAFVKNKSFSLVFISNFIRK